MMVDGPDSYPVYSSAGPGDIVTAMGLCYAITAALYKRSQTGLGIMCPAPCTAQPCGVSI